MSEQPKIAVFFPGIGYNCDKPLLYYTKKIAIKYNYSIKEVPYGGFPDGVKGSPEKMIEAFHIAYDQAEEMLKKVNWDNFGDILFVSKSIGTVVACTYENKHNLETRNIFYTPVEQTLEMIKPGGAIFFGNKDPWIDVDYVSERVKTLDCQICRVKDANHSLETGNVDRDISIINQITYYVERYIGHYPKQEWIKEIE